MNKHGQKNGKYQHQLCLAISLNNSNEIYENKVKIDTIKYKNNMMEVHNTSIDIAELQFIDNDIDNDKIITLNKRYIIYIAIHISYLKNSYNFI